MNSVHDIGGMDGFGPIEHETDEPVFHEPWESRVFGMSMVGGGLPPITLDARRHQLERLPPVQYLSSSYYERWLARIDAALVEAGTLTREEIDKRMQEFAAEPGLPVPRRDDPARADSIANAVRAGRPATRKTRQKPRFAIGDKIITRNLNPHGHTRLPRYARGKRGVIVAHHGAHVFPDTNAHGLGENPQHLYTVRIAMRELWGNSAEPNESVLIDFWESYLDKDKAAAKSTVQKSALPAKTAIVKTAIVKTAPQSDKILSATSSKRSLAMPLSSVTLTSPVSQKSGKGTSKRGKPTPGISSEKAGNRRSSARSGRSIKPTRRSR
ncbi:MAG: nitrile hydratase subunit beta [Deltaproteobacteria bacterium]|nr:nitrile hydratase subunit beta [Deltaproteobacteria bacterium]